MLDWCENNEQKNNFIIFSIFSDFTDKKIILISHMLKTKKILKLSFYSSLSYRYST